MKRKYPKYLEWVRTRNCEVCAANGPSEAHHLRGEFHLSGASLRAPDWASMPLCRTCHVYIHSGKPGWKEDQREALIRTLIAAFECGMIRVDGDEIDEPLPTRNIETKAENG